MSSGLMNPGSSPKLTSWAKEPSVADLKKDLEAARPSHDDLVARIDHWTDLFHCTGKAKPAKVKGQSSIQPKMIQKHAEWLFAALSEPFNASHKLFTISPRTAEDVPAAHQAELLLNYQWDTRLNRVGFMDQYVRSVVKEGTAIVETGWHRVTKMVTVEVPTWQHYEILDQAGLDRFSQALELSQVDPAGFEQRMDPATKRAVAYYGETGQVTTAVPGVPRKERVERVVENRPTVTLINPRNFWGDPSCGYDYANGNFGIVAFETSEAELKKDGRYRNLEHVQWEGSNPGTTADFHRDSRDNNFNLTGARKKVVAYRYVGYWDVDGSKELKPILAVWIGDVMVRMEEAPFPDERLPWVLVSKMPILREAFGEPDAAILEDNQAIAGAVTRGVVDLLGKSANSQKGYAKGMLDPINKARFEAGKDYEYNPGSSPATQLIEHKYPELPASAITVITMMSQEAEALSGVKAFSQGISGQAYGNVASLGKSALDATAKREMALIRRLAEGLSQIGRKQMAMNQAFLSEEEVVRVTAQQFVAVKREEIQGEFDLKVDISTPEVDEGKANDISFMLQTMGNTVEPAVTMELMAEYARLKRMPALEAKLRAWKPPEPDPLVVQKAQLELQELQLKVAKLQSEVALNEARTEKERVVADYEDLKRVEQEKGVTHARRVEEISTQAGANADAEVTKALLKPGKREERKPDVEAAAGWNQLAKDRRDPRRDNPVAVPMPPVAVENDPMGIPQ